MAEQEFQPGDWVQVWGQVLPTERVHPEDVVVEFFSHSEQWYGHVLRDRVVNTETLPDFVRRCTRLASMGEDGDTLHRCTKHEGHSGNHESPLIDWDEKSTSGYFEEAR